MAARYTLTFSNTTALDSGRLLRLIQDAIAGWSTGPVALRVRYSRGADFSGTCFYRDGRIFINLGRHLVFPYSLATHLARTKPRPDGWEKPIYRLVVRHEYELVLFVFLHELYHLLIRRAGRNMRQKESMCDRFAARYLVDRFGVVVLDHQAAPVPRGLWDFQDLDGFVERVRVVHTPARAGRTVVHSDGHSRYRQLLLFEGMDATAVSGR